MEPEITTKHLQGISDLTLVAPIKQGLISTLDTRTYASRLRAVLKTLHTFRQTSREHSLVRPFSDSTDRIRTITDLRMAIHEPEQKLLLSVTFDCPWEPYLRIIWRDVGTLLDVIFCNCDTYPISFDNSFATYGKWIREARTNIQFLYKPSAATFDDAQYLRQTEKLLSDIPAPDLQAAKLVVSDPAVVAMGNAAKYPGLTVRQGMQALSVLYRLADFYQPGTPDGFILLRASRELLRELMPVLNQLPQPAKDLIFQRFKAQLDWFNSPAPPSPAKPAVPEPANTKDVQGGILSGYSDVTHGCVLLIGVDDPAKAADFLHTLADMTYTEAQAAQGQVPENGIYLNVAFTPQGMRALGLSKEDMDAFPHEFLEGMEERAGLIGDVRGNHPRNWTLPAREGSPDSTVQLSTVHIVVQMSMRSGEKSHALMEHLMEPLRMKVKKLMASHPDVQLLSLQPMRRYFEGSPKTMREHFGFVDEISQPEVGQRRGGPQWSNIIGKGELLLGYKNDRGDDPVRNELLDNGSFLVMRKLRQDVAALNKAILAAGIPAEALKAKMMGRTVDGDPLTLPGAENAFDYRGDDGSRCPFAAHIRRANPRTENRADGTPTVPRIMRRGMSYGPPYEGYEKAERGLMFMCYNASIAEQFEVIQRWVSGGNSSGGLSEHSDPLLGVPQLGEARGFRFHDGARVTRVTLDAAGDSAFVRLEWGLYLFAPSTSALAILEQKAREYAKAKPYYSRPVNMPVKGVDEGEAIIKALQEKEKTAKGDPVKEKLVSDQWKAVLEDSQARTYGDSEAVWAAIRAKHGGVLRTLYGVLVGSRTLVQEVLDKTSKDYTVDGYVERLKLSIGEMYLGLDNVKAGCPYELESTETNKAIMSIRQPVAFALARQHAGNFLAQLVAVTKALAQGAGESTWELTFDIKEVSDYTLARLCETWFSLKDDGAPFKAGGWPWDWQTGQPPYYPGHFTAPSRYVFQANPGDGAAALGKQRGKALLDAMKKFVTDYRASSKVPPGDIVKPMFLDPNLAKPDDLLARTILGTLIGFLPTVEGNFRATLNEWLEERTFWNLQNAYASDARPDPYAKAEDLLLEPMQRTMQFRPAPEIGWRKPLTTLKLGTEQIRPDDTIVIGIVSATQEALAAGNTDVYPIFGGKRRPAADPHPTHACPGYEIGIGVLLGMITALIEIGPLRPTPAPLTVALRGTLP